MGALTGPIWFRERRVASGDVIHLRPRGLLRLWRKPLCAVVDARDRSIPYLVFCRGRQVFKVPLEGAFPSARWRATLYRLPRIDKARAATVAARAAERPGEGVHHPSYACGRELADPQDLVPDAYRAAGVDVTMRGDRPGAPLAEVNGDQDPPNAVILPDDPPAGSTPGGAWVRRGVQRTLPWQKRSRR